MSLENLKALLRKVQQLMNQAANVSEMVEKNHTLSIKITNAPAPVIDSVQQSLSRKPWVNGNGLLLGLNVPDLTLAVPALQVNRCHGGMGMKSLQISLDAPSVAKLTKNGIPYFTGVLEMLNAVCANDSKKKRSCFIFYENTPDIVQRIANQREIGAKKRASRWQPKKKTRRGCRPTSVPPTATEPVSQLQLHLPLSASAPPLEQPLEQAPPPIVGGAQWSHSGASAPVYPVVASHINLMEAVSTPLFIDPDVKNVVEQVSALLDKYGCAKPAERANIKDRAMVVLSRDIQHLVNRHSIDFDNTNLGSEFDELEDDAAIDLPFDLKLSPPSPSVITAAAAVNTARAAVNTAAVAVNKVAAAPDDPEERRRRAFAALLDTAAEMRANKRRKRHSHHVVI